MASETMKTVSKVDKKDNKAKDKKPNPFVRFAHYVKEVIAELKRVSWPTRKDLISATGQVILFVSVMALVIFLLDLGLTSLFKLIMRIGA